MDDVDQAVRTIRFLSIDAVEAAKSGHPGAPMGLAGVAAELFAHHLRYDPAAPNWLNRDRFILSAGHASMLLYSTLHLAGYDLGLDDIRAFRQWESRTPGHPEYGMTPGVETTTGPLGQGVGNAVGMALASKMLGARLSSGGRPLIDYRVFAIASDGDLMEGVAYEAASLAGHWGLDNLVVIYDDNRITIDGSTELAFTEDVAGRFDALGWMTQKVDGHDRAALGAAIERAVAEPNRPSLILARTHIGFGSPSKQDQSSSHGAPLGTKEVLATKAAADWPVDAPFHVPPEAYRPFRARVEENRKERLEWEARIAALGSAEAQNFADLCEGVVPDGLFQELLNAIPEKADATRNQASAAEARAAELVPALVGGSADLAGSAMTLIKAASDVGRGSFEGRNLHYGVREHAMGAISNGLALGGLIPFASTFLIFSDYMRPSIRLAGLMGQQVIYVFSHDSVFLGEDGPTHQPVEHLASLRLIPNVEVIRPADRMESAYAWARALERRDGPTVLAVSRQKLPILERPAGFDPQVFAKGAYVLCDVAEPTLTLVASGSEVHLAVEVKMLLEGTNAHRVRVVSAPCITTFEALPAPERRAILGEGVRRVSIEAGRTSPWRGIVGDDGICIGIDRFGASAPYDTLKEKLGLTAERVVAQINQHL
jgi:transketolase